MPHIHKKAFYPEPLSISNKLYFDVGNILIKIQQEFEKTIQKADKGKKILRVRF